MNPTQQEIIELAREAGANIYTSALVPNSVPDVSFVPLKLERFATLLLERFGAGGGEPVAYDKTALNAFAQDLYNRKMREGKHGHYESMYHVIHQCIARTHTHPSPTDLRAEYLRGLEDAAKVCDEYSGNWYAYRKGAEQCAASIRALKGKK